MIIWGVGHLGRKIAFRKTRAAEHLNKAGFGRIKSQQVQPLVHAVVLIQENHGRFGAGIHNSFNKSQFGSEVRDAANYSKRIFEVIQQAKTKNEIESSEPTKGGILRVNYFKPKLGVTALGLFDVFGAAVNSENL